MVKIIHQIWVGPEIPQRFIQRSKKIEQLNPEHEFIRWDETRLIQEFPDIKQFLDLECVPAFISDWARYHILQKYGGWYIDYDFTGFVPLDDLYGEQYNIVTSEFEMPGLNAYSGFIYFNKGQVPAMLLEYLPDVEMMTLFNEFIDSLEKNKYCLISKEKVSQKGTCYREERMRSFYLHKNYKKRFELTTKNYK